MHHLLTFLGTSHYKKCAYFAGQYECVSELSSIAVCGLIKSQSEAGTRIRLTIFATQTAKEFNTGTFAAAGTESIDVEWVDIPETAGEESFWKIFQAINAAVDPGETVWLDITHSFRYLPMLGYSVLDYLQRVRGFPVGGIYYGAAEILGPIRDWPDSVEKRRVPLHDLSSFLNVNRWAGALRDFNESGSARAIRSLTDAKALPLKRSSKGKNIEAAALERLGKALDLWSKQVSTCRGARIQDSSLGATIVKCVSSIGDDLLPPLSLQFDDLLEQFGKLKKGSIQNVFFAAEWCSQKGLVQQSWTLLFEAVIGYYAEEWSGELAETLPSPLERRGFVSELLIVVARRLPEEEWRGRVGLNRELARELARKIPTELPIVFQKISLRRNDINHAGFLANAASEEGIADVGEQIEILRNAVPNAL